MSARTRAASALRVPVLLALFTAFALLEAVRCSSLSSLLNTDVWWHLSTGLWILHHHALPHRGLFSQSSDAPWIAASWIYDLKLAIFYRLMGLRALPLFSICLKAGLAVITFLLAGGRRGHFWAAVSFSLVAQYILAAVPPAPAFASIILFGVELLLLLESRRRARLGPLLWLPPLFLLWANADVHFVYGLALLLVFSAVIVGEGISFAPPGLRSDSRATHGLRRGLHSFAASRLSSTDPQLASSTDSRLSSSGFSNYQPVWVIAIILAGCIFATLITPYFYHPYGVFFSSAFSSANTYLPDFHAPGFRQPQDYLLLLLAMSAFLALGLRRSRDLFLIALLAIGAGLSFYSQRDVWLVTLAAVAVIGETLPGRDAIDVPAEDAAKASSVKQSAGDMPVRDLLIAGSLAAVVVVLAVALVVPRSPEALLARVGQSYPVAASHYIRGHRLPQPLFNAFEWGGFLTWYLPEYPVAIDGRIDLYGDDFIIEYSKVMNADARYTDFPAMANAGTIVLPSSAIMAQALKTLPAFKVAYSDRVALVLMRNSEDGMK